MEDLHDFRRISINEIYSWHKKNELQVDRTYQRASNWRLYQQQFFIDSLLRGFPLPMIYLHHDDGVYNIVDGQQRINAIIRFIENKFILLEPKNYPKIFPKYLRECNTEWSGLKFNQLSNTIQDKIQEYLLSVNILEFSNHEIRDLFIRLQAGVPLTGQQKRDASVSGFNDFILKIAGKDKEENKDFTLKVKDGIEEYTGHEFFNECVKGRAMDRGQLRQLASNIAMLYFELIDEEKFVDIGDKSLDEYYNEYVLFKKDDVKILDFEHTLEILHEHIEVKNLENHEAIHLVLFCKFLKYLNPKGWKTKIFDAFNKFRDLRYISKEETDIYGYWLNYGNQIGKSAGSSKTIERRHTYFTKKMLDFILGDFTNSSNWNFDDSSNSLDSVYLSSKMINRKKLIIHLSDGNVDIKDALSLVVIEYFLNKPYLSNTQFQKDNTKRIYRTFDSKIDLPNGSKLRKFYKNKTYNASVINGNIIYNNKEFTSPSPAAMSITGTKVNGWRFWEYYDEATKTWRLLNELRNN